MGKNVTLMDEKWFKIRISEDEFIKLMHIMYRINKFDIELSNAIGANDTNLTWTLDDVYFLILDFCGYPHEFARDVESFDPYVDYSIEELREIYNKKIPTELEMWKEELS